MHTSAHFIVRNCYLHGSGYSALSLLDLRNGIVRNVRINGTASGIFVGDSQDVELSWNYIGNTSYNGVLIWGSSGVSFHNNTLWYSIFVTRSPLVRLENNTVNGKGLRVLFQTSEEDVHGVSEKSWSSRARTSRSGDPHPTCSSSRAQGSSSRTWKWG